MDDSDHPQSIDPLPMLCDPFKPLILHSANRFLLTFDLVSWVRLLDLDSSWSPPVTVTVTMSVEPGLWQRPGLEL